MTNDNSRANESESEPRATLGGRWVVAVIFTFAILAVATMWVYLDLHTAPFRPLRRALATKFKDSAPNVEGGQTKMYDDTPVTLRIVMRVEFNPNRDPAQAEDFAKEVFAFSKEQHDLSKYDIVEIHFFHPDPEQKIEEWTVNIDAKTGEFKR